MIGYLPEASRNANAAVMPGATSALFGRFYKLTGDQRRLLWRAALMLSAASAAVALLPFRRAIRFGSIALRNGRPMAADQCIWAIEAAARRLPWRTMCIEKGLATQRMLRSAGIAAVLHYGARHHPQAATLEAHVWVTVEGKAVIGGEEAAGVAEIARYP